MHPPAKSAPHSTSPAAAQAATVCVIDDDDLVRATIGNALRDAGYNVIEAGDGRVGMRLIERDRPDVVVTDIVMPTQEGIETIIEIRRRFAGTRILAISGGGRVGPTGFLDLAASIGADECLAKPFRPSELVSAVARLLEH